MELGQADCIQGPHGAAVVAGRCGCWHRESQGIVVMEGKVGEVRWDERVWQGRRL